MIRLALALCLIPSPALARDNGQYSGDMRDWYARQQNIIGQICCTDADGHEVQDWGRTSVGYWVIFDGHKYEVPDGAMVNGAHPFGKAVVWIYPVGTDTIRCFLPGMEG